MSSPKLDPRDQRSLATAERRRDDSLTKLRMRQTDLNEFIKCHECSLTGPELSKVKGMIEDLEIFGVEFRTESTPLINSISEPSLFQQEEYFLEDVIKGNLDCIRSAQRFVSAWEKELDKLAASTSPRVDEFDTPSRKWRREQLTPMPLRRITPPAQSYGSASLRNAVPLRGADVSRDVTERHLFDLSKDGVSNKTDQVSIRTWSSNA